VPNGVWEAAQVEETETIPWKKQGPCLVRVTASGCFRTDPRGVSTGCGV